MILMIGNLFMVRKNKESKICKVCNGSGSNGDGTCSRCDGSGIEND